MDLKNSYICSTHNFLGNMSIFNEDNLFKVKNFPHKQMQNVSWFVKCFYLSGTNERKLTFK
jgi:hypothetical protein